MNWKVQLQSTLTTSNPVIDKDNNIIFGTNDGMLLTIGTDGVMRSSLKIADGLLSSPVIGNEGVIFVCSSGEVNSLYALDPSGELLWKNSNFDEFHFDPVMDADGNIYLTTWYEIAKINREGKLIWRYPCQNISSCPVFDSFDNIYFSSRGDDGWILSLDSNGNLRWKKQLGNCYLDIEPVIDEKNNLYLLSSDDDLHSLYSLDPDGNINWSFRPIDRGIISSPAISRDGFLVMGTTYFKEISVDLEGRLVWETGLEGITQHTPILDSRNFTYTYTLTRKRKTESILWCLNSVGDLMWRHKLKGAMSWFHFGENSNLITKTLDPDSYLLEITSFGF